MLSETHHPAAVVFDIMKTWNFSEPIQVEFISKILFHLAYSDNYSIFNRVTSIVINSSRDTCLRRNLSGISNETRDVVLRLRHIRSNPDVRYSIRSLLESNPNPFILDEVANEIEELSKYNGFPEVFKHLPSPDPTTYFCQPLDTLCSEAWADCLRK